MTAITFYSCERDEYVKERGETKIAIEGWIEEGDVARVLISRSIRISELIDSTKSETTDISLPAEGVYILQSEDRTVKVSVF
jgi:hypothetical protein